MNIETETLAACPFCGGEVELITKGKLIAFKCADTSPCIGSWLGTYGLTTHRETAIAAWNRRTPTPPTTATVYCACGFPEISPGICPNCSAPPTTALDALREDARAKLAEATGGEWYQPDGEGGHIWNNDAEPGEGYVPDRHIVAGPNKPSWVKDRTSDEWLTENARNLSAIVAAVNYLRAGGLDEASALAGEVARLREACEAAAVFCTNHGGWFENNPMEIAGQVLAKINAALRAKAAS